ncbi:adenylyl cyclase X E isoform X5 [Drosophila mojavensis]|uniref:adenylyl cyclase X E isoform X5 n=1 Tax=Drosophila mojavensis TaxID=7230 RepID=UPI001CD07FB0|nr:adenylyl cyclase X E isoform X5 [Drosophila mojavensis]
MQCKLSYGKELRWDYQFLRKKCKEVGIEDEFHYHQMRLRANNVYVFQALHAFLTLLHCGLLIATCMHLQLVYIDIICYMVSAVIVIVAMWVNVNVKLGLKYKWLKYVTSTTAALCVLLVDMGTNFYHEHFNDWFLETFFDTYIIIMIYMFFPIPDIPPAMGLAATISAIYIIYYVLFLGSLNLGEHSRFGETIENLFYYISLNMMCTYFLIMREIVVRASFLDRHQYVMEDIALRSARATERIFLHTILPPQIAQPIQDEIRNRIKIGQKHHDLPSNKRDRVIAIQMHPDVSILYADIVNYTHLTTTLSVKELVTLLHELYARFDNAASRYAVQRIKFLGDCYYCVAGLIKPDPAHAICCVNLGLCMIDIIREVRDEVQIGIDIRVGVHSGSLFAGVLGSAKLQYDIWVNIYLTSVAKCELYYEDYEMVAVMFASLQNFDLTLPNLHILNDIIVHFDQILYFYREDNLVEKIKIVGCTYMAACGLDLRFSSLISNGTGRGDSVFQEIHRERVSDESAQMANYTLTEKREEVVLVLTTFALDLMRTLWVCKNNYMNLSMDRAVFNADISIGISCGEVMAGVVGASQVHYDIWGNAVNMASRMDSTGVAGEIQVTEETAVILSKYGIECNYRGMTFVKGLGMLPTYFVGITSSFEFVNIGEKSLMSNASNPHSSETST